MPGRLASAALAELAELHVRYEESARLASVAEWATSKRGKTPDFVIQTLRHVIDHCRDQLSDAYLGVAALYVDHGDATRTSATSSSTASGSASSIGAWRRSGRRCAT